MELVCKVGCLFRADGSARLVHGGTDLLASVTGPAPVPPRKESIDKATIEVSIQPNIGTGNSKLKEMEQFLVQTLEHCVLTKLHPSTLITVTVQIISQDGNLLSTVINAATLALLDAGVPMAYTPAAVEVACLAPLSGGAAEPLRMICWPTSAQEAMQCSATIVYSNLIAAPKHASPLPSPEEPTSPRVPEVVGCLLDGLLPSSKGKPEGAVVNDMVDMGRSVVGYWQHGSANDSGILLAGFDRAAAMELWRFFRETLSIKTRQNCQLPIAEPVGR